MMEDLIKYLRQYCGVVAMALFAALLIIAFDHAMRVDQWHLCQQTDVIACPRGLWIWSN